MTGIPEPGLATRGRGLWKQATSSAIQLRFNIWKAPRWEQIYFVLPDSKSRGKTTWCEFLTSILIPCSVSNCITNSLGHIFSPNWSPLLVPPTSRTAFWWGYSFLSSHGDCDQTDENETNLIFPPTGEEGNRKAPIPNRFCFWLGSRDRWTCEATGSCVCQWVEWSFWKNAEKGKQAKIQRQAKMGRGRGKEAREEARQKDGCTTFDVVCVGPWS